MMVLHGGTEYMLGSLSWIDILFLVTVLLLVFNGFRNGFVISLIHLIGIPLGFVVALLFGPQFVQLLAANGLSITPFIAYIVLFFGTVLVLHIIGTVVRGVVRSIPLIGFIDAPLGALLGFIEAWLLWVALLFVLHNFLLSAQPIQGLNPVLLTQWQGAYNETVTNSLFARVNDFIIPLLPNR